MKNVIRNSAAGAIVALVGSSIAVAVMGGDVRGYGMAFVVSGAAGLWYLFIGTVRHGLGVDR